MPVSSCTVMELKVWVDGLQRVVCGVTEETTCQEVVIALAQAIGQTGRYVLIQRLRDSERQLLASESPLQLLAKCGQYANDVRFLLRRTGSSQAGRPVSSNGTEPRDPPLLPAKSELPKRREPRKSLTFTGGTLGVSDLALRDKWRGKKPSGTEVREKVSQPPPPSKDDLFKLILVQQEKLHSFTAQHESFDCEIKSWEQPGIPDFEKRLLQLEQAAKQNEQEIQEEQFWEREVRLEKDRERELQSHLGELKKSFRETMQRLHDCSSRNELLDKEIVQEGDRERRLRAAHRVRQTNTREAITRVKVEIEAKTQQNQELQTAIIEVERTAEEADRRLQAKTQELEELNKELRQCNLQQFIQQTGTVGVQARSDDEATTGEANQQLPSSHRNGDIHISEIDSPPRQTAKHFLGNPRNLQNPLVSSLNPEEFHHWIVGS